MKKLSRILLTLFVVVFTACSSDDDNSSTTPTIVQASGTVNWSSFNTTSTDITSLVTFNGISASDYTIETIKGDAVNFNFNIGNKSSAKVTRELVLVNIVIDSPSVADRQFLQNITYIDDPLKVDFDGISGFTIGANAPDNYDGKFNMYFTILEDGVALPDLYIVDPKIKIRASR